MNRRFVLSAIFGIFASTILVSCAADEQSPPKIKRQMVIETVTLNLKDGVSYESFAPIDNAVKTQHVSKQPGFISRQAAVGKNGEWLVIVYWASEADADASMASFTSAPAAEAFMSMIDPSSMVMKRYNSM